MDLLELLQDVNGSTFVGLNTETTLPLAGGKENPHCGRIKKITTGTSVMVFQNKKVNGYQAMVSRRLEAEGKSSEFKLSPRKWGRRIKEMPVVEYEGRLYLEVITLRSGRVHYELDGKVIDRQNIIGFKGPLEEAAQGGLDNKVIIRTYAFDSLRSVIINRQKFQIVR